MVKDKVSLVTFPNPIVTSGFEFVSSTSADTWVVGRAIIINEIITTLSLLIRSFICLSHLKTSFDSNRLVTLQVT